MMSLAIGNVDTQDAAAKRVAMGLTAGGSAKGMRTSATATTGKGLATAAATPTSGATPATNGTGGNTITSNDFLTLLVTEMKNQDPTQPTDPNAYIQQLVGVNSLQQLISINSELGPPPAAAPPATGAVVGATPSPTSSIYGS